MMNDATMPGPVPKRYRIVQLSDCHLYESAEDCLLGINTYESLQHIIQHIKRTPPRCDVLVATGDLVHDGSIAGYRHLAQLLEQLETTCVTLPGNHDDLESMQTVMSQWGIQQCGHLELGNWRLIMLNSQLPGKEKGWLSDAELERLTHLLKDTQYYKLIFLHHQPVPVGSQWIDEIGLDNAKAFFTCLEQGHGVRGIVWGHVHQSWEGQKGRIKLYATPSTCIQFAPRQVDFGIAFSPPGWRSIDLYENGALFSQVHYLPQVPDGLELHSSGYA